MRISSHEKSFKFVFVHLYWLKINDLCIFMLGNQIQRENSVGPSANVDVGFENRPFATGKILKRRVTFAADVMGDFIFNFLLNMRLYFLN